MSSQPLCASAAAATARKISLRSSRDIALFERHWAWLSGQPRGINATLRLLVEDASRDPYGKYRAQQLKEECYFLMRDMVGDRPFFEEASRALFSGDLQVLKELAATWPAEVADKIITQATQACAAHASTIHARKS